MTNAGSLSAAVGRRLGKLRIDAGIPLDRLAKRVRLSAFELERIEGGVILASIGTLSEIATKLGASFADVVRDAKKPPPVAVVRAASPAKAAPPRPRDDARMGPEEIGRAIVGLPDGIDKIGVVEAAAVRYAVQISGGNKSRASRILGMERRVLDRRLRRHSK
jgi:transcriptional regulator with XRE-family HTH domain